MDISNHLAALEDTIASCRACPRLVEWRETVAREKRASFADELRGAYISAVVKCAPPANKPTVEERDRCLPYLVRELELLTDVAVIVALGSFGWDGALRALGARGARLPKPKPRFGHLAEYEVGDQVLVGSFHPSQQNTFTGKLTEDMLDSVFVRARVLAG